MKNNELQKKIPTSKVARVLAKFPLKLHTSINILMLTERDKDE